MLTYPTPLIASLVRRYIAWTERNIPHQSRVLRLPSLQAWSAERCDAAGVEILPLHLCGSERVVQRVHNETAFDSPGFSRTTVLHAIALSGAPYHDRSTIFLARSEGRYIGYCIGRRPNGETGHINGLAVHPSFRRRGIGRLLLRTTVQTLRERGAAEVLCHTHPTNEAALGLLHSEGFVADP